MIPIHHYAGYPSACTMCTRPSFRPGDEVTIHSSCSQYFAYKNSDREVIANTYTCTNAHSHIYINSMKVMVVLVSCTAVIDHLLPVRVPVRFKNKNHIT